MSDEPVVSAEPDYEAYVRAKWEMVHVCDGSYRDYPRGTILIQQVIGRWVDFPDWKAAYAHIKAVEEELRCLDREIELLIDLINEGLIPLMAAFEEELRDAYTASRTIQRLHDIRATAARGLKEGGR